MVLPLNAAIVSSTNPDSLRVSVWIVMAISWASPTVRHVSIATGVVPQSYNDLLPQRVITGEIWETYLVKLQSTRSKPHLIDESRRSTVVTLACESKVHRDPIRRAHHRLHVGLRRGAGRRIRSCCWTGTATDERRLHNIMSAVRPTEASRAVLTVPLASASVQSWGQM